MMKLTYDPRYNIAYFAFQEKSAQVETIQCERSSEYRSRAGRNMVLALLGWISSRHIAGR
jgi:hypothetical protein